MRIGILTTSMSNRQAYYYNAQDIGMAKALSGVVDEIIVYRLISRSKEKDTESVYGVNNMRLVYLPSRKIGINGLVCVDSLDQSLDVLLYFTDTQISLPRVFRWCHRNHIALYPYIGIIESHSTNQMIRWLMNILFQRNKAIYRKCYCFAKTPYIRDQLRCLGIEQIALAPVGLDTTLLKTNYADYDPMEIRQKYGYTKDDRIILFIGRLTGEKQPVRMIGIFSKLNAYNKNYKLLMVGEGELEREVVNSIRSYNIEQIVQRIGKIPNDDIWELYRMADCFVNLNQQEIFGMAILEAMYYGCKVVAWKAPGPSYIIENGVSGFLVSKNEEAVEQIVGGIIDKTAAHNRIVESFTWEGSAQVLLSVIDSKS